LFWLWWVDLGPLNGVTLGAVVEISAEKGEEVVCFRLESLRKDGIRNMFVVFLFFSFLIKAYLLLLAFAGVY